MPFELPQGSCLFCERITGERDDWAVIDQSELTISFVSPIQFEEGQCLVIPRRHAPTLLDLTADEASALMLAVRALGQAIVDTFDPDGLTLYQNNGVASLQAVPHVHMHVVPRRYGSGWGEGPPHLARLQKAEREEWLRRGVQPQGRQHELAERIRLAYGSSQVGGR